MSTNTNPLSRHDALLDELTRAQRAFYQRPTPALAASIKQILASLRYVRRTSRKGGAK
jgi:hypothetical protein